MKKAQTATEVIIILSILLLIIVGLFVGAISYMGVISQRHNDRLAETSLAEAKVAITSVYLQGNNSRSQIRFTVPPDVTNSSVTNNSIQFIYLADRENYTKSVFFPFLVTGDIPSIPGSYALNLESNGTTVIISYD